MDVKVETTLKKKVKAIFKKPLYSFKKRIKDSLATVVELNIPQPDSCPECR